MLIDYFDWKKLIPAIAEGIIDDNFKNFCQRL